jgi:hypothetical protein
MTHSSRHDRSQTQRNLVALEERIDGLKDSLDLKIEEVKDAFEDSNAERRVQLDKDHKALSDAHLFCKQALLATQKTAPLADVTLDNNFVSDGSCQYVGADVYDGTFNLSASGNKAATQSFQAIGLYSPESIKAMSEAAPSATTRMLSVALKATRNIHHGVRGEDSSMPIMTWNRLQSAVEDETLQASFASSSLKSKTHDLS